MTVRTRFAPSPTGSLHVGGARTALYCWLHARKHGGRFLLRIEDTDQARSSEAAAHGILRDMRWLGLEWDEGPERDPEGTGPFYQSERLDRYDRVFDALLATDSAYEAWESADELAAARDAVARGEGENSFRRPNYSESDISRFKAENRTPVLRLDVPAHAYAHDDLILGPITMPYEAVGDLVIRKTDGFPTYHLAVVADDHAMNVSLVIRGQEHLANTAKHLAIYERLGWSPPEHAHLPLIFNPNGGKMSKRDKAKTARTAARTWLETHDLAALAALSGLESATIAAFVAGDNDALDTANALAAALHTPLPMIEVMDFRRGGYLPDALLNYLALLGWNAGDDVEIYLTLEALTAAFDIHRVGKTAARFDATKLVAINKAHLQAAPTERLLHALDAYLAVCPTSPLHAWPAERREALLCLYRARIDHFADLDQAATLYTTAPTSWDEKAVSKHILKTGATAHLPVTIEALAGLSDWTAPAIEAALQGLAETHTEGKVGKIAQPVRIGVTGNGVSPGIGETLALLGQAETVARLRCFTAHLAQHASP